MSTSGNTGERPRVHWPRMGEALWTGDPGPAPKPVRVAAWSVGLCAVPSLYVAVLSVAMVGSDLYVTTRALAALFVGCGLLMAVGFPYAAVGMLRRGRVRMARRLASALGVTAFLGAVIAALSAVSSSGMGPVLAGMVATAAIAFAALLLLRRRDVSLWLDRRRHHVEHPVGAG